MDLGSSIAMISHQMASGFPGVHKQLNGFRFSRNSQTTQQIQVFQEFMNNPMASGISRTPGTTQCLA